MEMDDLFELRNATQKSGRRFVDYICWGVVSNVGPKDMWEDTQEPDFLGGECEGDRRRQEDHRSRLNITDHDWTVNGQIWPRKKNIDARDS